MTRLALHHKYAPPPPVVRSHRQKNPPPRCRDHPRLYRHLLHSTAGLEHRRVRGWSPCTRGFVRGGCGGGRRRCWFEGGLWDAAWKAMNSRRRSSEGGDPPAHVSWDCLRSADSSSVQQQKQTHPAKLPFWFVLADARAAPPPSRLRVSQSILHRIPWISILIQGKTRFELHD